MTSNYTWIDSPEVRVMKVWNWLKKISPFMLKSTHQSIEQHLQRRLIIQDSAWDMATELAANKDQQLETVRNELSEARLDAARARYASRKLQEDRRWEREYDQDYNGLVAADEIEEINVSDLFDLETLDERQVTRQERIAV